MRLRVAVVVLLLGAADLSAQELGERVLMSGANSAGIPVHPEAGNPAYVRWANGTVAVVISIDARTQWRQVEANNLRGWVTQTYLTVLNEDDEPEATGELPTYVIGTWNLEWLHDNRQRGFPESTRGGPKYGPREPGDYQALAVMIRDQLDAKVLILSEINGATSTRSEELDRLLTHLGGSWGYYLAPSGGQQRLAVLFDSSAARREKCVEMQVPAMQVQNKNTFDRRPLVCAFQFIGASGARMNDLLVVAVHLASGQQLNENHDAAMTVLSRELDAMSANGVLDPRERDVLIAGDFNASRYDNHLEMFWDSLSPDRLRFRTLSPSDGDDYPGTRLAGIPLAPKSQIDYMMASGGAGGLVSKLGEPFARVRVDLLPSDFNIFRRRFSDHIPVTIRIRIVPDDGH